jgi:hypothetical protein
LITFSSVGECNEECDPSDIVPLDIALADRLDARHFAIVGARMVDLDVRSAIPQRQATRCQDHESVAKDAVAHETFGIRAIVGMEGVDAPAFDLGNVNRMILDLTRSNGI